MNITCQKYIDGDYYAGKCWWTNESDGFVINDNTATLSISDASDSQWFSRLYSSCSLVLEQGLEGNSNYRNFSYRTPSNAIGSFQEFAGGFLNKLPGGFYPQKEAANTSLFGQYYAFTDNNDEADHMIVQGYFDPRNYDDDEPNLDRGKEAVPVEYINAWDDRTDAGGDLMNFTNLAFPKFGSNPCSMYSFENESGSFHQAKTITTEVNNIFVSGLNKDLVNTVLEDEIRNMI
jgi:hypothetical protein